MDGGGFGLGGPTRFEYDPDDVLAVDELGDGVFRGLVVVEEIWGVENLAADCTWVNVIGNRKK